MRIFGHEFVEVDRLDALRETAREFLDVGVSSERDDVPFGAAGSDGRNYAGLEDEILGPDLNPELTGARKYEIFDEMRLTDPACRSLLWLFKLPIRSARWGLSPAGDDPLDKLVADACAAQFGLEDEEGWLNVSWTQSLAQPLLSLDFGAMGEEIIWRRELRPWFDADGDLHELRTIVRLAPRYPVSFVNGAIETDEETGRISRARQWNKETWIPGRKLGWYRVEPEDPNYFGTSLLRAVYGPWRLKKSLMISAAIGWDRYAAGTPIIRYPSGGGRDAERRAEQIGRNYRVHERAWVALEGPEPTAGQEGWSFKVESASGTLADPVGLLRHYDEQIATGGVQMFARLGTTERGSRAVGEVLADPYFLAVSALAHDLAEERRRSVIRRYVDVNFGPEIPTPKLTVAKIQAKNLVALARILADLSSAGFSFADRETQNDVRDQLDLPMLSEPVVDALRTVEEVDEDDVVGLEGTPPVPLPVG